MVVQRDSRTDRLYLLANAGHWSVLLLRLSGLLVGAG